MDRIVFIENRERTHTWKWMAEEAIVRGYEVHWIVQNHLYAPKCNNVHIIPYPKASDVRRAKEKGMPEDVRSYISSSDRNLNFFGVKNADYYYYYYQRIDELISSIQPFLVFGENTEFHELLAISLCKYKNILYLHPTSCRYPSCRFSFYLYDSLTPFSGSGVELPYDEALQIANEIASRQTMPSYMASVRPSLSSITHKNWYLFVNLVGYLSGEHFCTPSPFNKVRLNIKKSRLVDRWGRIAKNVQPKVEDIFILYPMHLQPESSIDVWGNPYRDQLQTIKEISGRLNPGEYLVVKANPHANYELSDELIDFIENSNNVLAVPLSTPMGEVLPSIDLVLTITGTIAIECIVSNKPVVTMVKTLNNDQRNCLFLSSFEGLRAVLDKVKSGSFPVITDEERVAFINTLVKTSFEGDPYTAYSQEGVLIGLNKVFKELENK